jgi:hypothetical protein
MVRNVSEELAASTFTVHDGNSRFLRKVGDVISFNSTSHLRRK